MSRSAFLLALVGCSPSAPPPSGTLVGNPGKTEVAMARVAEGLAFDAIEAEGATLDLVGCDGARATVIDHADTTSLLDGDAHPVPGGSWCGLTLDLERIFGTGSGGELAFELTLEPAAVVTLWAAAPVVVDETDYILELSQPDWLLREDLPPPEGDGQPSIIGPESELAAFLVLGIVEDSAWYLDDGDGILAEAERAAGPLAAGTFPPPPELGDTDEDATTSVSYEGCGCASPGSPAAWLWIFALTALRRTGGPRRTARG